VDEQQLLQLLRQPETRRSAFSQVISHYQKRVYGLIRKMVIDHDDTDDLVQEVFIKVWNHLDNFKGESQLFTWIYRIATNETLNFLRKKKRFTLFGDSIAEEMANKLTADKYIDADEIQLKLQKAILQLPDKQRLVFHLKYFDELPYEEIAAITETSVGALKASYHHAVKKIGEYLQNH
jgi:RNA polymerase sigma factor (sigma-70 family)